MRNASAHALPTPHGDSSSAIPPWCLALPFCDAHTVIRNKVMIFCGKGKILRAFTKKKKERDSIKIYMEWYLTEYHFICMPIKYRWRFNTKAERCACVQPLTHRCASKQGKNMRNTKVVCV